MKYGNYGRYDPPGVNNTRRTDNMSIRLARHLNACHLGELDTNCNGCKELMSKMTSEEVVEFNRVEEI